MIVIKQYKGYFLVYDSHHDEHGMLHEFYFVAAKREANPKPISRLYRNQAKCIEFVDNMLDPGRKERQQRIAELNKHIEDVTRIIPIQEAEGKHDLARINRESLPQWEAERDSLRFTNHQLKLFY